MLYTHTHTHTSAALVHLSSGLNRNGAPPLRVAAYEALYYHILRRYQSAYIVLLGTSYFFCVINQNR